MSPAPAQLALIAPEVDRDDLIRRLFSELFRYSTTAGHRAMANYRESKGECSWRGCSPSCASFRALMDETTAYLEQRRAAPPATPRRATRRSA